VSQPSAKVARQWRAYGFGTFTMFTTFTIVIFWLFYSLRFFRLIDRVLAHLQLQHLWVQTQSCRVRIDFWTPPMANSRDDQCHMWRLVYESVFVPYDLGSA